MQTTATATVLLLAAAAAAALLPGAGALPQGYSYPRPTLRPAIDGDNAELAAPAAPALVTPADSEGPAGYGASTPRPPATEASTDTHPVRDSSTDLPETTTDRPARVEATDSGEEPASLEEATAAVEESETTQSKGETETEEKPSEDNGDVSTYAPESTDVLVSSGEQISVGFPELTSTYPDSLDSPSTTESAPEPESAPSLDESTTKRIPDATESSVPTETGGISLEDYSRLQAGQETQPRPYPPSGYRPRGGEVLYPTDNTRGISGELNALTGSNRPYISPTVSPPFPTDTTEEISPPYRELYQNSPHGSYLPPSTVMQPPNGQGRVWNHNYVQDTGKYDLMTAPSNYQAQRYFQRFESYEEPRYEFEYEVRGPRPQGPWLGHGERRAGDFARGEYHALLPDGRRQVVRYEAGPRGYRPQVFYEYPAAGSNAGYYG